MSRLKQCNWAGHANVDSVVWVSHMMKRVGIKATDVGLGGLVTPACAAGAAMVDTGVDRVRWS